MKLSLFSHEHGVFEMSGGKRRRAVIVRVEADFARAEGCIRVRPQERVVHVNRYRASAGGDFQCVPRVQSGENGRRGRPGGERGAGAGFRFPE